MDWQPIETAPKDGSPIWAWLYDTGIRMVFWQSAEAYAAEFGGNPDDYISDWTDCQDHDNTWHPKFWLPAGAIPLPRGVIWVPELKRWRNVKDKKAA